MTITLRARRKETARRDKKVPMHISQLLRLPLSSTVDAFIENTSKHELVSQITHIQEVTRARRKYSLGEQGTLFMIKQSVKEQAHKRRKPKNETRERNRETKKDQEWEREYLEETGSATCDQSRVTRSQSLLDCFYTQVEIFQDLSDLSSQLAPRSDLLHLFWVHESKSRSKDRSLFERITRDRARTSSSPHHVHGEMKPPRFKRGHQTEAPDCMKGLHWRRS